jgi:hypothetical protein
MGEGLLYDTDINEMKDKKYYIVCHVDLYIHCTFAYFK